MGSFNTTCSVSNLPIGMGDDVKVFFLIKSPFKDSRRCYINDDWNLFGIPLDATYDDYGQYTLKDDEKNLKIWECYAKEFKERIIEMEQGPNQFHDCPVSKDNITFASVQNAIWENRAFLYYKFLDDEPKELEIEIMAVHKSVYESVTKEFEYWRETISLEQKVQQIKDHPSYPYYLNAVEFMANYDEEKLELDDEGELTEEASKQLSIHMEMEWVLDGYFTTPRMYEKSNIHLNTNKSIYNLMKYDLSSYAEFVTDFIEMYLFECNMSKLNIPHAPMLTSGQDYHFMAQIAFHENIIALAKQLHQVHDTWDD